MSFAKRVQRALTHTVTALEVLNASPLAKGQGRPIHSVSSDHLRTAENYKQWILSFEKAASVKHTLEALFNTPELAAVVPVLKGLLETQLHSLQVKAGLAPEPLHANIPSARPRFYSNNSGRGPGLFQQQPRMAATPAARPQEAAALPEASAPELMSMSMGG
jgi:hypothetical protein